MSGKVSADQAPADEQAPDDAAEAARLGIPCLPRSGEDRADYLTALARTVGALPGDARLDDAAKRRIADELVGHAREDEYFGGSRAGKVLLTADVAWRRQNPEISGLGTPSHQHRGVPKLREIILGELIEDARVLAHGEKVVRAEQQHAARVELALDVFVAGRDLLLAELAAHGLGLHSGGAR